MNNVNSLTMKYDGEDKKNNDDGDDEDNVKNKEACVRSWEGACSHI